MTSDQRIIEEQHFSRAHFRAGAKARRDGRSTDSNMWDPGTEARTSWMAGWAFEDSRLSSEVRREKE